MNEIDVKKAYNILHDYCEAKPSRECSTCFFMNNDNGLCRMVFLPNKFNVPDESDHLITHPAHYTDGNIEVWDFIVDKKLSYFLGNVIKYVCRAGKKDASKRIEDLKKARAYIDKQIELWESESK